jgi:hypothetical protein
MLTPGDGKPCRHYIRPNKAEEPGFCLQPNRFRCIEALKVKLQAISYSSLTDFIHCKLRYKHRIIDGLEMKPQHLPEPLKLGTAWDIVIRSLYNKVYEVSTELQPLQLDPMQMAKISALARAYRDLEIQIKTDNLLGCQYKIHVPVGQEQIIGYVDRAYENHIVETKFSSRPDFYKKRENLTYQLGTYFMGNEAWEYADVEITRVPALKPKTDESTEAYEERIYGDVLSRPAFYFQGWDRKTRTYGVRFWRSEFDLDEIFRTYVYVLEEIKTTLKRGSWYPNYLACHVPTPCQYLPIKKAGVISEEIFERRKIPEQKGGEIK